MTQVPTAVNETTTGEVPLVKEHAVDVPSREIVTASPDVDVAVAVYGAPPTVALDGTVEVMVIVCGRGSNCSMNVW